MIYHAVIVEKFACRGQGALSIVFSSGTTCFMAVTSSCTNSADEGMALDRVGEFIWKSTSLTFTGRFYAPKRAQNPLRASCQNKSTSGVLPLSHLHKLAPARASDGLRIPCAIFFSCALWRAAVYQVDHQCDTNARRYSVVWHDIRCCQSDGSTDSADSYLYARSNVCELG